MTTFDRGFKSRAELTSLTVRRELDLAPADPLDPKKLANFLDVKLWTPDDVPGLPKDVRDQLLNKDPGGWSAVSMLIDGHGLVIYNPKTSLGRRASDIAHELGHFILDHEPCRIILSPDGSTAMRSFDQKQEDEANWLAWCLLLPREALISAKRARLSADEIASRYGVSKKLVTFRLGVSGVDLQFKRRRPRKT